MGRAVGKAVGILTKVSKKERKKKKGLIELALRKLKNAENA